MSSKLKSYRASAEIYLFAFSHSLRGGSHQIGTQWGGVHSLNVSTFFAETIIFCNFAVGFQSFITMLRILSVPLSLLAYFFFFLYITVFHPISVIAYRVFGYQAHKKIIDVLYFCLLSVIYVLFSRAKIDFRAPIPVGKPVVFVANHQSLFDIMTMGWFLRRYHPKFVSKIELGRNIPSVSYNLRHGGSVLIDRKNPRQALPALKQMGEYIQKHNRSVVIYPEGTRSRDGRPGHFSNNGLKILCKFAPDALVVPVTINDSWRVFRYGGFPFGLGTCIKLIAHEPMAVKDYDFDMLFEKTVKAIVDDIK